MSSARKQMTSTSINDRRRGVSGCICGEATRLGRSSAKPKCSMMSRLDGRGLSRFVMRRCGFTLVEMMISVALVLLMMTLFAQIFQMAGASVSKQRGIMENDQRSRTLQTVIKGDLDKRTFRKVFPFASNEDISQVDAELSKRRGYFYYSENDPNNPLDDVLQFTIQSSIVIRNGDETPYFGRGLQLTSFSHANQPDADDAQLVPNNTAQSTLAEICYFVRNGNLYRRQLLIREPLSIAGSSEQPLDSNGNNFFDPTLTGMNAPVVLYPSGVSTASTFWGDFDMSARLTYNGGGTVTGAGFLGQSALSNNGSATSIQLGHPKLRFGFQPDAPSGVAPASEIGQPKEYTATSPDEFFGRYTLEECSHSSFTYPQAAGGNPMKKSTVVTLNSDKVVTAYAGGTRRGEDLLLSNVHSFDVQIWDSAASAFVNIDGTGAIDYAMTRNKHLNPASGSSVIYGPRTTAANNRVFDTWHPHVTVNGTADVPPPFRPRLFRPAYQTDNGSDTTTTKPGWQARTAYNIGDIIFPAAAELPNGAPFYYRCIDASRPVNAKGKGKGLLVGRSGDGPISWPRIAGLTVEDNSIVWQAVDNRVPLKAVKLEIRFMDGSTQQMRQLTLIQSLVD